MAEDKFEGKYVIECGLGDTVKICHSLYFKGADDSDLVKGFRVADTDMGDLTTNAENWNCVNYIHKRAGTQVVEFTEDMFRRRSYIQVSGNIPLHDHASVPQGGPAYATYYSEIEDDAGE